MATVVKTTIVEVDEPVEPGELEKPITPHLFVSRIVEVKK